MSSMQESPPGYPQRFQREHLSLKDAAVVRETMRVTYPKRVIEDTRTHAIIHSRTVRVYSDVAIVCQATPTPFPPGWNFLFRSRRVSCSPMVGSSWVAID
ncbi:hypothetical protein EVAR_64385_1 [Eumeta japonica]|uniref:Uncharacterized protein n=1 Tax=Eumeta variegata TaxID=151549 RepID=A0A4C1SDR7_EUMVA|nr:hypothetical protein EVAR_64385_1 [Eumeta japonica]